jgi:predicted MFS family arabinose efflux permease
MALVGSGLHLTSMLTDRGMTLNDAVNILSLMGISLALGRLGTGYLLDRASTRIVASLTFAIGALGVVILSVQSSPPLAACVGAVCLGLAQGAEGDLTAYMVRRYFGQRSYGKIYGMLFSAFNFGVVAGPLAMGVAFDHTGSYYIPLRVFAACTFGSAVLVLFAGRPAYRSSGTPRVNPTLIHDA